MDWIKPYLVSRARIAALRAMVDAGGRPADWQVHRAIEPILGDLLPLPSEPRPGTEARASALRDAIWWGAEARRRSALGTLPAGRTSDPAVDSGSE